MKKEELLIERLKKYWKSDMYPFHMPGHKRAKGIKLSFPDPFSVDITEIDGFDNLHHAEGILKDSMEWASCLYGSDRTWYLVNGSTCGLLSAISAAVSHGGKILVSRNCHKAVYHGIYLNHLEAVYVYPQPVPGLGIQGGILPEDVEKALKEEPDIQAVLMVSPTYDGIVSDVKAIADVAHKAGIPLIVDEAHGAHFAYGDAFPKSALELGADAVIQSVHKTLPSLTQTALLHVKNNRPDGGCYLDIKKIERYLQIYQSSSPSYVLMASIENSIFLMDQYRKEGKVAEFEADLLKIRKKLEKMKYLRLVEENLVGTAGISDVDISKIVVSVRGSGLTGEMLSRILREKYHLEMEMTGGTYVLAMTTVADTQEGLDRLKAALLEIDGQLEAKTAVFGSIEISGELPRLEQYFTPQEAADREEDGEAEEIPWKESEGHISLEYAYLYPPGSPVIVPGERISREAVELLCYYETQNLQIEGIQTEGKIKVWKHE